MTLALNTGPGMRVGAIEGVGRGGRLVSIEALGVGTGDLGRRTATAMTTAKAKAPTRTDATTARNVRSLIRPPCLMGRPGSSPHPIAHQHSRATQRPASK